MKPGRFPTSQLTAFLSTHPLQFSRSACHNLWTIRNLSVFHLRPCIRRDASAVNRSFIRCSTAKPTPDAQKERTILDSNTDGSDHGFRISSEQVLFQRYKTIYERNIAYPDGQIVSFDVEGSARSNFRSVLVFPYDSKTKTTTMIRELHPGTFQFSYGFVAGFVGDKQREDEKNAALEAAKAELNEEAHLKNGTLIPLLAPTSPGLPRDKYSRDYFDLFLALDCEIDSNPAAMDDDEVIEIVRNVPIEKALELLHQGHFNLSSSVLFLMALHKLREMMLY